jgi:hypothetical protein
MAETVNQSNEGTIARISVLEERVRATEKLMDERDRRYMDRFTAMDEKTSLALTSSKEAVQKAEIATEKRFDSVNEFRGQLKDQAFTLLPRIEAEGRFGAQDDKLSSMAKDIISLRESRSEGAGAHGQRSESRQVSQWLIALVTGLVMALVLHFWK